MARRNRRLPPPVPRVAPAPPPPQAHVDGDWHVRRITGAAATKPYVCPGCNQQIPAGTAHLVAWSADRYLGEEFRRHWHTPCWEHRLNRR